MRRSSRLLVTCEHGGNRIPSRYSSLFARARGVLGTHRGFDIGALPLARAIARRAKAPLVAATISRLLVDLNRSVGHADLFSRFTSRLTAEEKERLLELHYHPHRLRVEAAVRESLEASARVIHVAVHTFTPRRREVVRRADVGLLYDPRREPERDFCLRWRAELSALRPRLRIRLNYPYRGWTDGLPTALRSRVPRDRYMGVELEVNQKHFRGRRAESGSLATAIARSMLAAIEG